MSARKAGQKAYDWVKLSSMVPKEAKAEFAAFRSRHEAAKIACMSLPETPEPIDWDSYRRSIRKPGLVDSFQKQFQAVKVPYPKDTYSEKIAQQEKDFEVEAQEAIKQAKSRAAELRKELDHLRSQKPFDEMTVGEYLADKPEMRRQIDVDIRNHHWY